jgi:flavin reductase ActVB
VACEVDELLPGGDHLIALGRAADLWASDGEPLVFYRGDYWSLTESEPVPPLVDEALEGA